MEKSSSLGMSHDTPRNIQEVQASNLEDAMHPHFIKKHQVTSQYTIFLLFHILCAVLGTSLFLFLVLFYFVCGNKWLDPVIHILQEMFSSLYFVENYLWELFQNKLIGVGDESYIYSDANRSLFRPWHVPWLVMLGVILHVLVIIVLAWLVSISWECLMCHC